MTTKVRKQIYLEKRQNQQLKRLAKTRGVSEAELVRRAIDHEAATGGYTFQPDPAAFEGFIKFARQRAQLGGSGEPYKWNREDAYEEREERLARRLNEPKPQVGLP